MPKTRRHFIVRYASSVIGLFEFKYTTAETPEALTKRMWMLNTAQVIEVTPIAAWSWNGHDLKPEPKANIARTRLPKADSPR